MNGATAEAAIRTLEGQRCRALIDADWNGLRSLLTEDLIHVHSSGAAEGREDYLAHIADALVFLAIDRPSLDIRFYGTVAVMVGPLVQTVRVRATGETVEVRITATQVWVETGGAWRQASFQATAIR